MFGLFECRYKSSHINKFFAFYESITDMQCIIRQNYQNMVNRYSTVHLKKHFYFSALNLL